MALAPCSSCGSRYRGKGIKTYVFISGGPANGRYTMKFDPTCGALFVEHIDQELAQVATDVSVAYPTVDRCMSCVLPIRDASYAVIITVYDVMGEQRQWFGGLHVQCGVPEALAHWLRNGSQAA